jgi:hypothetical protein
MSLPWTRIRERLFGRRHTDAKSATETATGERLGYWSDRKLQQYAALAADVPGEFAEVGVAFGRAFRRLVPLAHAQGKRAHAFDSFEGMAAPGEHDRQQGGHPKGQFNVGGVARFQKLMDEAGLPRDQYRLWSGFIPGCFETFQGTPRFSLAIIDVDHFAPTRDSLDWIWPLAPAGAVFLCDDYARNWNMESSRAIDEFLHGRNDFEILEESNNQISLRKTRS